ncbi:MAG: DUF1549 domain-containing protein [Alphaproteobacteria bacterium]|nr:DUF1549 domain-containing protein [Alphaproteobacteria bacterium]
MVAPFFLLGGSVVLGGVVLSGLVGCGDGTVEPADSSGSDRTLDVPEMSATELYTRASLDLRGVRPTVAELQALQADPAGLDDALDALVDDPRFGARMGEMWSEIFLTRTESLMITPEDVGIADRAAFYASVGDEPMRMVQHIADYDLPWTEIVVGDWTMANDVLLTAWPLEGTGQGRTDDGWQVARYTDGRPQAGVLAGNGMWWRYSSTDSNANRGRANQVSRILLCNDYLTREIDFERNVDLLDEEAVLDAIHQNPGCVSCHASLDPIASYLFGFWTYVPDSAVDSTTYHPEREQQWQAYTGVAPAWYGEPGSSLSDLGEQIAGDARFPDCAVQHTWELMLRRDATLADTDLLVDHREAFLKGGLTLRALARSIVDDPMYRAGATGIDGAVSRKLVTSDLLASQVEGITGFRWTYGGYDMLQTDVVGVRTLAGGADGYTVSAAAKSPNATLVLVQERLALNAALYAVVTELEQDPGARTLFTEVDLSRTDVQAGEAHHDAAAAQLQRLYLAVLSREVAADGPEVAASLALFDELAALGGSAEGGWAGVLAALLRDPDFVLY